MNVRILVTNASSAVIALALLGIVLGTQTESLVFPILTGPRIEGGKYLPEPVISEVRWIGTGEDARLFWRVNLCKHQNAVLERAGYTFWYFRAPEAPGVSVAVINETRHLPIGATPLPMGCLQIDYSARLPDEPLPEAGDYLVSRAIYQSSLGFWWSIIEDFGTVVVPSAPPP